MITVYAPQISVKVKKVIRRTSTVAAGVDVSDRVSDEANALNFTPSGLTGSEIDLTPFLGEGCVVQVHRTVRGSDSGSFSITFPDQMHPDLKDSIYGLVEPQDVVEIRMSRDPVAAGAELPIVLRGFISTVSRPEVMTEAGPQRRVMISGHDYSKILNIIRFIYLPTMIPAQLLLSSFSLFLNYGVDASALKTPAEFVIDVCNEVVGEFLTKMQAGSGGKASPVQLISPMAIDAQTPSVVAPFGVQAWEGGNVWDLLSTFGDVGAWNELFVRDDDDGPTLVYRPLPYKDAAGGYIQAGTSADEIEVSAEDVILNNVERSDADVSNYFWVDAARLSLLQNPLVQLDQQLDPSPALDGYQNCNPIFYGIRLMRVGSNQLLRYDGKPAAEIEAGEGEVMAQINEKRRLLIEYNKDNAVFENGSLTLKGSPLLRAGDYLVVDRGGFKASYYMSAVDHMFVIGGSYTTSATVERGTGFIERVQRGESNPAYLAELTAGGTYD